MDKFLSLFENKELIKTDDYNNYKINYNEEQLKFIESPLQNAKLLGIPGGGKTQSIIGKIIHHYIKSEINQNNNFLILTFSKRACNDFIEKGKKQNRRLFNTKNIKTLHSLAGKIVYKIMEKKSSSQDTIIISSLDIIDSNKEEVLEMEEFSNLKIIFIDEAQDISYIQYQLVLKISKLTNCFIVLVGDPNQNIYQFQNGSDEFLMNHEGETFSLIKNYRSTPHIVNFINQFRPWNSLTSEMTSTKEDNRFNKKPIIFTGIIQDIIKDITDKIINSPFPKEEIAIIGPVKKSKPYQDSYTNIGLSIFTNILEEYNIKFIKHYGDNKNNEESITDIKKVKGSINLMTIHGSKGLEFQQVFLLNFHTCTFGIIPTEEKYKEFKYLWYVGLSRACSDLNIYIDKNKQPWNELKNCPNNLYDQNSNIKISFNNEIKFQEEIPPIHFPVTEILNNKKLLDDKLLFDLEKIFKYSIITEALFEVPESNYKIKNYKEYSALYGCLIENIFNFYYNKKNNKIADFIIKLKKIILNTILIPKHLISSYKILKLRCPFIGKKLIKLADFSSIKNKFKKQEEDLYSFLCESLNFNYKKEFYLECYNEVINYSKSDLLKSINYLENINNDLLENEIINNILYITIFYYQIENETSYLWKIDLSQELNDLNFFIKNIIKIANETTENFNFHEIFVHSKLPIIGELDMLNNNKIVDIKFSNNLNIKHILQILLYQHLFDPKYEKDCGLELWNFYLGHKYIIKLDKTDLNIYQLLKILSKAINKKLENMIFMYDLETTGLLYSNKKIDIIDRHFEEYTTSIIPSTGLLKPVDVPFIPFEITKLTGITKEHVYERGNNFNDFKREMDDLLKYCNMPIFIAHNGNCFDHKILINKNIITNFNCKLLDSRIIIKLFLNDDVANKSLLDIFQFLFKFTPIAHRANSDVKMLISIFRKLDINEEKILNM